MMVKRYLLIPLFGILLACNGNPESAPTTANETPQPMPEPVTPAIQSLPAYIVPAPDDLAPPPRQKDAPYQLVEENTEASDWSYQVANAAGEKIDLPDAVALSNTTLGLGLVGDLLTYGDQQTLMGYHIDQQKEVVLHQFAPFLPAEVVGSFLAMAPNQKAFALVLNAHGLDLEPNLPDAQILLIRLAEDGSSRAKLLGLPIQFECGNVCNSTAGEDFFFVDDETLAYKRHWNEAERPEQYDLIQLPELFE